MVGRGAVSINFFSALGASVWSKNKGDRPPPPPPGVNLGSETVDPSTIFSTFDWD